MVLEGRPTDAIEALSVEISSKPRILAFNNRATARILCGDLAGALSDFAVAGFVAEGEVGRGDHSYIHVAAVLWMQGHKRLASRLSQYATREMLKGRFAYSDAAGGADLGAATWFFSSRLKDKQGVQLAERLLAKLLKGKASRSWPGPLARFLLNEISEVELVSAVSSVSGLRERELCQANFYVAARRQASGDAGGTVESLKAASASNAAVIEVEYHLARYELGAYGPAV